MHKKHPIESSGRTQRVCRKLSTAVDGLSECAGSYPLQWTGSASVQEAIHCSGRAQRVCRKLSTAVDGLSECAGSYPLQWTDSANVQEAVDNGRQFFLFVRLNVFRLK
ncbi:hypothetical protein FK004_00445 [Flavobacterium kingsejongi]|uniref:Uncharacterized protein n=1 Tax=Flavobacterium kingsejongi TaxID=1678728 RepID=A0A2S1LJ68_9FLAO|nr:hypothetical protein FK004_00445 [Flavobacterium kingsejongi]